MTQNESRDPCPACDEDACSMEVTYVDDEFAVHTVDYEDPQVELRLDDRGIF